MPALPADETDVLIGVGVGPGDPELITLKAVRALRSAGTILVPTVEQPAHRDRASGTQHASGTDGTDADGGAETSQYPEPGRAEATVLAHLDPDQRHRILRVGFAMTGRAGVNPDRRAVREAAASVAIAALEAGAGPVAFATIGDPSVYATFGYVARAVLARRPTTTVEVIPGIMAMQDLAARTGTALCEGTETLTLIPATAGLETVRAALRSGDTVVTYKVGQQLPDLLALLEREGRLADTVVGCGLGLPDERIVAAQDLAAQDVATGQSTPYLTTVLTARHRETPGGDR